MKYPLRFIFVIFVVSIGHLFLVRSVNMQENRDGKRVSDSIENCVKVTLIADSDKYELKKGNPISVIVRIENLSKKRLKLRHDPVFNFRRVGVKEDKIKLGDSYTGRINSKNSSNSGSLFLEKRADLDFVVDITELELMDAISSINVWPNIFTALGKSEYYVDAEVTIGEDKAFKEFRSNKILVVIP